MNYAKYKVNYEYKSYNQTDYIEKSVNLVLPITDDVLKHVNTYRLSGFEGASIKLKSAELLYDVDEYIIDLDVNNNHLSILRHTETFFNDYECIRDQFGDDDIEDILETLGYKETAHDNSYNWGSDYSDDIDFKIYQIDDNEDGLYDENALILVNIHKGLDARAGYSFLGLYKNENELELNLVSRSHISVWLTDDEGNEVAQFDGDYAVGSMLEDYTLTEDSTENDIKVKCNETNRVLTVNFY